MPVQVVRPSNKKTGRTGGRGSGTGTSSQSGSDRARQADADMRNSTDGVRVRKTIQEIDAALKAANQMTRVAKQNEKLMSTREISEIEDPLREARDELIRTQAMLSNRQGKDINDVIDLAKDAIQSAKNAVANAQRLMNTAKQTSSRSRSQPTVYEKEATRAIPISKRGTKATGRK